MARAMSARHVRIQRGRLWRCVELLRTPGRRIQAREPMSELSRREMLQATAAALSLPLVKLPVATGQAPKKFFTPAEFAVVDELSDMIIPTDEKSVGARAAGVAACIDARLAESFEHEPP